MSNWARASVATKLLAPVSAANTAAATSAWIDVTQAEGVIVLQLETGAITGSIVWTVEHATSVGGAGSAAFTPDDGAFGTVTANTVQKRFVDANSINGFLRCVGTITTGPVVVSASCLYVTDEPA